MRGLYFPLEIMGIGYRTVARRGKAGTALILGLLRQNLLRMRS